MSKYNQNLGISLGNVSPGQNLNGGNISNQFEEYALTNIIKSDDRPQDVKLHIEHPNEDELTPVLNKTERADGIQEFRIHNCTSSFSIFKVFQTKEVEEEFKVLNGVIILKFQLNNNFEDFSKKDLIELCKKCNNKSVLIQIQSNSGEITSILWKSNEIGHFLTIESIRNIDLDQRNYFYEFACDFLADSLKNGRLGLSSTYDYKVETTEIEVNFLADSRDFNLLFLGCEKGNAKIVKTCLALGMSTSLQNSKVTPQFLAMQGPYYDVIYELTDANLPFPKSLDIKKCPEDFRALFNSTEMLHEHIKANNVENVKEVLLENPQKSYFYNYRNESALKVALKNESMECYELLLSMKLRFGPHEDSDTLLQDLSEENKRLAREIHNRHTQNSPMKHVNILMANSFVCHDVSDPESKMEYINWAYRTLNLNVFIRMLLMIVAASKKFKIIFDFNRESVSSADPTVGADTQGLFYMSGRIYIGAKQLLSEISEHETLATIAHELCHYVMNLVFKNDANPYRLNDKKTMEDFDDISKICQEKSQEEFFIDLVYRCYPEDMYHAELIVRVVHLMALYKDQPEKLREVSETYSKLFEFYEKIIHPQLEEALPEIEAEAEKENEENQKLIFKYKFFLICGAILCAILFVAGFFIMYSIFYKPTYVFNELSDDDKLRVRNAGIIYKNIDLKFDELFYDNSYAYGNLTSDHIKEMLDGERLDLSNLHLGYLNAFIDHKWINLTEKLKDKILDSNFIFQGENLSFSCLNDKIPIVLNYLTSKQIEHILEGKIQKIGNIISNETKFYIERKVVDEDFYAIYMEYEKTLNPFLRRQLQSNFTVFTGKFMKDYSYEENESNSTSNYSQKISEIKADSNYKFGLNRFKDEVHNSIEIQLDFDQIFGYSIKSKFFILSAEAGAGKTVTFEQLTMRMKKKFPLRWVSYIDLKDFTKFYNANGILSNIDELMENILQLSIKNEFESQIFKQFFKSGNVVLFWNGFDEISPDYSEFILNVLSFIRQNTKNIQFVCTRPLYAQQLSDKLHSHTFTLVPLTKPEQSEFLQKLFTSENVTSENISGYIEKISNVTYTLNINGQDRQFDTPQMLVMLAVIITSDQEIYMSENIYQIYEKFVNIKIENWKQTELGRKFVLNSYGKKFSMLDVFLKFSLKSYNEKIINLPRLKIMRAKIPKEITNAEISRTGILYINGPTNYEFAHRTFEEFFFAEFLINNIYSDDDDLSNEDAEITVDILRFAMYNYEAYPIVFKFINEFLKNQDESSKINPKIAEILITKHKRILFSYIRQGNVEAVRFLYNICHKDNKIFIPLLGIDQNETLYTANFNPTYYKYPHFPSNKHLGLREFGKEVLTDSEKFINGKNQKGLILFNQLFWLEKENILMVHDNYILPEEVQNSKNLTLFIDIVARNLTDLEIDTLFLSEKSPLFVYCRDLLRAGNEDYKIIEDYLIEIGKYEIFLTNLLINYMKVTFFQDFTFNVYFQLPENAVELIKPDIYELFLNNSLLNYVVNTNDFELFWNFFKNYTNENQQKKILLHQVSGMCFNDLNPPLDPCNDSMALNIFHLAMISIRRGFDKNRFALKLYEKYFNKTEVQDMVLKSNDFIYYMVFYQLGYNLNDRLDYLRELFIGNESRLYEFLMGDVKLLKMNVLDYLKDYAKFKDNLVSFTNFLNQLK